MQELNSTGRERWVGIAFGFATHALFALTVYHLFRFLNGGHARSLPGSQWTNALLTIQFAVPHSILLHPRGRSFLGRWIPKPFYGCFFCVITCLSLLLLFTCWQSHATAVWHLTGWAREMVRLAFYGSWLAMFYSMSLTGLGYQTGWTPWWHWVRGRPLPKRTFTPKGIYMYLRHPIYLSFLGLLWFTPEMTADRALLCVVWTTYIFIGSYLKDERLAYFLGDSYREYQSRVPGYPFFPLRRWTDGQLQAIPIADSDPQSTATKRRNAA